MLLNKVKNISDTIDTDKKAFKVMFWSFVKACFVIGLCVASDFNKVILSMFGVYYVFKFHIILIEIGTIRKYLGAFYSDLNMEETEKLNI